MRTREIHRQGGHAAGSLWVSVALTVVGAGWLATGIALAEADSANPPAGDGLALRSAVVREPGSALSGFASGPLDGLDITFLPLATELPPPPPLEATGRSSAFAIVPTPGSGLLLLAGGGLSMRRVGLGKRRSRVAAALRGSIGPEPRLA